jgi:GntR family transcriptional regulator, transcriptional repressor for pyruvate dehydrogenase complex
VTRPTASPRIPRAAAPAEEDKKRPLAATTVFEALAGSILRGKFPPGSPLPPEREIAALFNVSRLIVRQALHRLREIGLLRGGQGGQTIVLDPDASNDPRIVALTIQLAPERADEEDVIERQLLAGAMLLELAQLRITAEEIDALERLIEAAAASPRDVGELEMEFWVSVARAGRNRMLVREARWWFEILRDQPERRRGMYGKPELRLALYRAIVDHLRRREDVGPNYLRSVRALLTPRS